MQYKLGFIFVRKIEKTGHGQGITAFIESKIRGDGIAIVCLKIHLYRQTQILKFTFPSCSCL